MTYSITYQISFLDKSEIFLKVFLPDSLMFMGHMTQKPARRNKLKSRLQIRECIFILDFCRQSAVPVDSDWGCY